MKKSPQWVFRLALLRKQLLYQDDEIALRPLCFDGHLWELDGADSYTFQIICLQTMEPVGEIAVRVGECAAMYYLGHIGYHIDPPWRGHRWATHACRLIQPFLVLCGFRSLVITTDIDNYPSIRVCEALGCVLESTVPVPLWCRTDFELSDAKKRFVLLLDG